MKLIRKGKEPKSLTFYKKQANAYYDGADKVDIRQSLLEEQGYLCAYCMKRIRLEETTIEHLDSQSHISEKEALNYERMVGVCLGRRGAKLKEQTCDAHRGNIEISVNPFLKASIDKIKYGTDGRIYSEDSEIDKDLDKTLNLNCEEARLKENRKATLEALKKYLYQRKDQGIWSKEYLEKIKQKFEEKDSKGQFQEYAGLIVWYLNKRINKNNNLK